MSSAQHQVHKTGSLMEEILDQREISVQKCYQCGKCSAGCPLSEDMDFPPSIIMRMLQTEIKSIEEQALRSMTIWLCVTCETCATRCPMEIDIPGVMDFCRQRSLEKKMTHSKARNIISFHKAFLDSVDYTGRLYEVGLYADYKARTFHLAQDMNLAPGWIAKGKLGFFPELIKDRKGMSQIFKKTLRKRGGKG